MQQQLQRAQTPTIPTSTYYNSFPPLHIPHSHSQPQIAPQISAYSSNKFDVERTEPTVPSVKPQPSVTSTSPVIQPTGALNFSSSSAFQPPNVMASLPTGHSTTFRPAVKPKKPEFRGCLRSTNKAVEVV